MAGIQMMGANFDPDVLQWPGGAIIAMILWLYATVKTTAARRSSESFASDCGRRNSSRRLMSSRWPHRPFMIAVQVRPYAG
jgi:hypothetical protein